MLHASTELSTIANQNQNMNKKNWKLNWTTRLKVDMLHKKDASNL